MQRQFGWHALFLHAWYEFRILADPNSYRGQEENSFPHAVWPVSFLADAVWAVKCTSDLPACNALGPGRTNLGFCHRLLEWHQCDGQNVQPGTGKPRDRAQAIQEMRPEAEAPKVCIVMHWNQVPWEEEWCQQCSCDCRSHPDTYGLAKTKESEGAGEFSWFCELPQRVHVWSSREVVSSVSTDRSQLGVGLGRAAYSSSFWKKLWQNFPFWVSPTHVTSLSWILMRRMLQSGLSWVRFRRAGSEPSLSLVNLWIKLSDPIVWWGRSCWLWWCSRITFATTCWDELSQYRLTMQA